MRNNVRVDGVINIGAGLILILIGVFLYIMGPSITGACIGAVGGWILGNGISQATSKG